MKHIWKVLFFTLLSLNLIVVGCVFYYIFQSTEEHVQKGEKVKSKSTSVEFIAFTDKHDLDQLINEYLQNSVYKGEIGYEVTLTDFVVVSGMLPIFSTQVKYELVLEPLVVNNGDLTLQLKSIKLGKLNIPANIVLSAVKDFYKFPGWVEISPEKRSISVAVTDIKLKSDFQLRMRTFDLKKNDISFKVIMSK